MLLCEVREQKKARVAFLPSFAQAWTMRLLRVCCMLRVRTPVPQVALGKSAALTKIDTSLTAPPAGHDSVHGVRYVVTAEITQSSTEPSFRSFN